MNQFRDILTISSKVTNVEEADFQTSGLNPSQNRNHKQISPIAEKDLFLINFLPAQAKQHNYPTTSGLQ